MPRDANGNTQPIPGTLVSTGDTVLPSQHNPMVNDLYAMMTQSLSRDGQGGMRSPLDMSGYRIINVGTATNDTDAVSLGQSKDNGVPIGTILDFAGTSAPTKFLFAFGQAVSRTTYSNLFSVIGTAYGSGDGSTTFNLPDLRGRISAGKDDMGGTDATRLSDFFGATARTLAGVLGSSSVSLTGVQNGPHTHTGTTDAAGSHQHIVGTNNNDFAGPVGIRGGDTGPIYQSVLTNAAGNHQHTFTTASSGTGSAHSNAQPTIIMNKIIKALI